MTCNWLQNCTSGVFQLFYCFRNSEKEKEGDGEKVRGERIEGRVDNPPPFLRRGCTNVHYVDHAKVDLFAILPTWCAHTSKVYDGVLSVLFCLVA